jgi:ribonuclease PH
VALALAMKRLQKDGRISVLPKLTQVAAVSVGVVKGEVCVDLDYEEDSSAEVDMNIVALEGGKLVELQGTAEHGSFDKAKLDAMLEGGLAGIQRLMDAQRKVL